MRDFAEDRCTYLCYGRERGSQNDTPHLQGFFISKTKISRLTIAKCFPRSFIEQARGSSQQASEYCKKEGDYVEFGECPGKPGNRSDLNQIRDEIKAGASSLDVAEGHFSKWCLYRRSFQVYRELLRPPSTRRDLVVRLLVGHTGAGKTRYVFDAGERLSQDVYVSGSPDLQWFDGYCGQDWVLLDDYRGGAPFEFLLRLLDIYPLRVPIKGGFVSWNPRSIWITSNLEPHEWYPGIDVAPLQRRIGNVVFISQVEALEPWETLRAKLDQEFGILQE